MDPPPKQPKAARLSRKILSQAELDELGASIQRLRSQAPRDAKPGAWKLMWMALRMTPSETREFDRRIRRGLPHNKPQPFPWRLLGIVCFLAWVVLPILFVAFRPLF